MLNILNMKYHLISHNGTVNILTMIGKGKECWFDNRSVATRHRDTLNYLGKEYLLVNRTQRVVDLRITYDIDISRDIHMVTTISFVIIDKRLSRSPMHTTARPISIFAPTVGGNYSTGKTTLIST